LDLMLELGYKKSKNKKTETIHISAPLEMANEQMERQKAAAGNK